MLAALRWNVAHGIRFFRISSDLIPFGPLDAFPFDWAEAFDWKFRELRRLVKAEGLRVTSHPGQYTVLNSPRPEVVDASVEELDFQAEVLRRIDPKGTLTLHVGGAYGDKEAAMDRFAQNLDRLGAAARERLIIENDDTTFTLEEVVGLAERTGLRVVVDLFHHKLNPGEGRTWDDGLVPLMQRAVDTWGGGVPKLHLSSHRAGTRTGHADTVTAADLDALLAVMEAVGTPEAPYDVMLEAKSKEHAVLDVRRYLDTGEPPAVELEPTEAAG